jgi:hypothetical protein
MSDLALFNRNEEVALLIELGLSPEEAEAQIIATLALRENKSSGGYTQRARVASEGARIAKYYKSKSFKWNPIGLKDGVENFNGSLPDVKGLRGIMMAPSYYNEIFTQTTDGWYVCQTSGYSKNGQFAAELPKVPIYQYNYVSSQNSETGVGYMDNSAPSNLVSELGLQGTKNGNCHECILAGNNKAVDVEGKTVVCGTKAYLPLVVFEYAYMDYSKNKPALKWVDLRTHASIHPFKIYIDASSSTQRSFEMDNSKGFKEYFKEQRETGLHRVYTQIEVKKVMVDAKRIVEGVGLDFSAMPVTMTLADIKLAGAINKGEEEEIALAKSKALTEAEAEAAEFNPLMFEAETVINAEIKQTAVKNTMFD